MYQDTIFATFEEVLALLRPAFRRGVAHRWFGTSSLGLAVRDEDGGVASVVRALGLRREAYGSLLGLFRSDAVDLAELTRL